MAHIIPYSNAQIDEAIGRSVNEYWAEKTELDAKQDKLTAGDNITIDENNVISASGSGGGGGGRNLFDNPFFQVNQRGITDFTNGWYGVDRWKLYEGACSVVDEGISLNKGTYNCALLCQPLDEKVLNVINGKTVTMSVLFADNTIYGGTVESFNKDIYNSFVVSDGLTLDYDNSIKSPRLYLRGDETIIIKAVELIVGSTPSLSADSVPPDYAEELAKCQRYFFKLSKNNNAFSPVAFGYCNTATSARIVLDLPTTMRTPVAVDVNSITSFKIIENNTSKSITAISIASIQSNAVTIIATGSGFTVNNLCSLGITDNIGSIGLSADL